MFNFNFMKNTNEENEMVTLDGNSGGIVEQGYGVDKVEQEQSEEGRDSEGMTPEEETESANEEDATLRLIRDFPKVCERIAELMRRHAEEAALEVLQKGEKYDEAVANADKEGYLRGKNEKIELVKNHRLTSLDEPANTEDETQEPAVFPRYSRRSVWDR